MDGHSHVNVQQMHIARHPVQGLKGIRPRYGDEDEVRPMVPGYIEAEDDPLQVAIQGDKRQSQSAEITALEKQSRVDGS